MVLYGCTVRWRLFNPVLMRVSFGMLGPSQKNGKWSESQKKLITSHMRMLRKQNLEKCMPTTNWWHLPSYRVHHDIESTLLHQLQVSCTFHHTFNFLYLVSFRKKKQPTNNQQTGKTSGRFFHRKNVPDLRRRGFGAQLFESLLVQWRFLGGNTCFNPQTPVF